MTEVNEAVIRGATILTVDGRYFDFDAPDAGGITLNAVARGLANTVCFGGQCERFYSVAEHSDGLRRQSTKRQALATPEGEKM